MLKDRTVVFLCCCDGAQRMWPPIGETSDGARPEYAQVTSRFGGWSVSGPRPHLRGKLHADREQGPSGRLEKEEEKREGQRERESIWTLSSQNKCLSHTRLCTTYHHCGTAILRCGLPSPHRYRKLFTPSPRGPCR